jgi:hypothetical protein
LQMSGNLSNSLNSYPERANSFTDLVRWHLVALFWR